MKLIKDWWQFVFVFGSIITFGFGVPDYLPKLLNVIWAFSFMALYIYTTWKDTQDRRKLDYARGWRDALVEKSK